MRRALSLLSLSFLVACSGSGSDGSSVDQDGATTDDTGLGVTDATSDDTGSGGGDTGAASDTGASGDGATGSETSTGDTGTTSETGTGNKIKYVWVIVEENHNWSAIKGSASAPYINKTLLVEGAHAEQYYNPPKLHPSEPNYIWMEAGDNLGITDDKDPSANHQSTKSHLVTQLQAAGVTWRSWQDSMPDPMKCPLSSSGLYGAKHNPMVFFDDVTNTNSATSANCIEHVRPFTELETNLTAGKFFNYNFISPDLCNDMHGATSCALSDLIKKGDDWLAAIIPKIQATTAYKEAGAIFVTWDEAATGDGPIGMIVLSPFAKKGYSNMTHYTHSSFLRTIQTIFGVSPLLRDAAKATDLSDLFTSFP